MWWYINLEEPWRRTDLGFDSRDHDLDLSSVDLVAWQWKDEDELTWAVERGQYTRAQADAIRTAGEQALERCRRREPPFDQDWAAWRPDRAWGIPCLPPDGSHLDL